MTDDGNLIQGVNSRRDRWLLVISGLGVMLAVSYAIYLGGQVKEQTLPSVASGLRDFERSTGVNFQQIDEKLSATNRHLEDLVSDPEFHSWLKVALLEYIKSNQVVATGDLVMQLCQDYPERCDGLLQSLRESLL